MKKAFIRPFQFIRAIFWCLFNGVKYKKGLYIGHFVKKTRKVKLFLSKNCRISSHCLLWGNGEIVLGENSSLGSWSRIYSHLNGGVRIGKYFNGASHLYIIDSNHTFKLGTPIQKQPLVSELVVIGDDVWCGYNVTILPGVKLGNGCVCGACSVVTKCFENNSVICGNPAKVIKTRQ